MEGKNFTGDLTPQDEEDYLRGLSKEKREMLVGACIAYHRSIQDPAFDRQPDDTNTTEGLLRIVSNGVETANHHAKDVKDGVRAIQIEIQDSHKPREKDTLHVDEPASLMNNDVADTLIRAYWRAAGTSPASVFEALVPIFRSDLAPERRKRDPRPS